MSLIGSHMSVGTDVSDLEWPWTA